MFTKLELKRVRELVEGTEEVDQPTLKDLRSLLIACFRASLRTEEGRRTRFNVAFVQPCHPQRPKEEGSCWWPLRFTDPGLPLSERELVKLAQAADPRQELIGVRRASGAAGGDLTIWGTLVVGLRWWEFRHARTMNSQRVGPPYLTVQVVAPGTLVVAGPKGSLRFVGDEPEDGRLVALIDLAWRSRMWSDVVQSEVQAWPTLWARSVDVVLQSIAEAGHGGALFILPDDAIPSTLDVKYCIEPASARLPKAAHSMQDAEDEKNRASPSSMDMVLVNAAWSTLDSRKHEWLEAAECVARHAGVDGAMLLTRDLRLRGFGAVVRHATEHKSPMIERAFDAGALGREPYDLGARGTRHRSAAIFCAQNPGAAAFVVSQDGDISAMRFVHGTVVVWRVKTGFHVDGAP